MSSSVPIYDARGFDFKEKSMENLKKLRPYQGGKVDVPPYSIVTVGYGAKKYEMPNGCKEKSPTLAARVLFVLFHGIMKASS